MKNNIDLNTKDKILQTAQKLFLERGYEKTTIREILTQCNVTTGSLYHFFTNKEDILFSIVRNHIDKIKSILSSADIRENNPTMILAASVSLQFHIEASNEKIAELHRAIYNSQQISEFIYDYGIYISKLCMGGHISKFSESDFYIRAVAIKGIYVSFMSESLHYKRITLTEKIHFVTRTFYKLFDFDNHSIDIILQDVDEFMKKPEIEKFIRNPYTAK